MRLHSKSTSKKPRRCETPMNRIEPDLFTTTDPIQVIGPGARVLHGFALDCADRLLRAIEELTAQAPFRHMVTPGGFTMSAAMSNCGQLGWVTDRRGYRYADKDPQTSDAWPAMPPVF